MDNSLIDIPPAFTSDKLTDVCWWELFHASESEKLKSEWAEHTKNNQIYHTIARLQDDNSLKWAEVWITPNQRPDKTTVFVGVILDLTDRKRIDDQLMRFYWLSERSKDLITLVGLNGLSLYMNKAGKHMLGIEDNQQSLILNMDSPYIAPSREQFANEILPVLKREGCWSGKTRLHNIKTGHNNTVLCNIYELVDETSQGIVCYAATAHDLTVRVRLHQHENLETVARLAGGVAHDFNNLLSAIAGYAELTERLTTGNQPVTEYVQKIQEASKKAAEITRQLLSIASKQILSPKIINLNNLILQDYSHMQLLSGETVQLYVMPNSHLWNVLVDPAMIETVLFQLVNHARVEMPDGGKLLIETRNRTLDELYTLSYEDIMPGDYVIMEVSDNGEGMSQEALRHLFEPYYLPRIDKSVPGLGLATSLGILRQHNGHIHAYSEKSGGTTFRIYLPRLNDAGAYPTVQAALPRGREKILVAEDDRTLRSVFVSMLQEQGYRVEYASCGQEALDILDEADNPFDLLIADVVMPGISIQDLTNAMTVRHPKVRILYTSGYTQTAIRSQGLVVSNSNFLQKPYSRTTLVWKVRAILVNPIMMD